MSLGVVTCRCVLVAHVAHAVVFSQHDVRCSVHQHVVVTVSSPVLAVTSCSDNSVTRCVVLVDACHELMD